MTAGSIPAMLERGDLSSDIRSLTERFAEIGPKEIGLAEIGPAEIGPEEIGPTEIGPAEIGPKEIGLAEIGPKEIGPFAALVITHPYTVGGQDFRQLRRCVFCHLATYSAASTPNLISSISIWHSGHSASFGG